ncbi:MAG TPA: curli-like amyloid fiber formation chaperone CsgH [Verrucomicrobiae bacterium]|jgi:hypothetical protein|nr:curli-like amyloid fiber formation chaperone CsgH [Verrucomicrobiae bacterium]
MWKSVLTATALIAASACAASAQSGPSPIRATPIAYESDAVECMVRRVPTLHGVRLEALARGDRDAYGDYEFVVTKDGAGGSSDIVQEGAFDLSAGEQLLGEAEFSMGRRDYYRARLVLRDGGGVVCRDDVRS